MKEIRLHAHYLRAILNLPDRHPPVRYHPGHLMLRCLYPQLTFESAYCKKQPDMIDLHVTLTKAQCPAEMLESGAVLIGEPSYIASTSQTQTIGPFRVYQESRVQNGLMNSVVTYVFEAEDGELVSVEDLGQTLDRYQVTRRIGKYLQLRYALNKVLGDDFIQTDALTAALAKSMLVRCWEFDPDNDDPEPADACPAVQ